MKNLLSISLLFFLLFGFIEHSNGQSLSDKQKIKIENQVDVIFKTMLQTAENLDYDMLSAGVDDRYNAGFIMPASYFTSYDSLINVVKTRSQGVSKQSFTIQKKKITVLSESIVLLTAEGNAKIDTNTGELINVKFFWSFVYEKINNKWKVIQSHQSNAR